MVLVRPLRAQVQRVGINWLGTDVSALQYIEPAGVAAYPGSPAVDMAPLDSYDFTGLPNPDTASLPAGTVTAKSPTPRVPATYAHAWHYARPHLKTTDPATTKAWRFVYPGRYDGYQTLGATRGPRQQGTQEAGVGLVAGWNPEDTDDPWDNVNNPTAVPPVPGVSLGTIPTSADATYFPYEYAIQLTNSVGLADGAAGPNPVRSDSGNKYPFGGFARNGDILQVPYIG